MTRLTVLAVPDCPNLSALEERLEEALRGLPEADVRRHAITTAEEAMQRGMHGSPTLLVDGKDPFAEPDTQASMSCRAGTAALPSVEAIRAAVVSERPGG